MKSKGAPYQGKDRRKSIAMKIKVKPFRLTVTPTRGGFVCEFRGTDANGNTVEIELEFPRWWVHEIAQKLEVFTREVPRNAASRTAR